MSNKNLLAEREMLSPPGETILETIEHYKMSQADLAERLGKKSSKVHDLITGKEPITLNTALQLEKVLGVPASFWLNREAHYREKLARLEDAGLAEENTKWVKDMPLKQLFKRGHVTSIKVNGNTVNEVLRFFGVASVEAWQNVYEAEVLEATDFRKSDKSRVTIASLAAWLRTGELEMRKLSLSPFDKQGFRHALDTSIKELVTTHREDFAERLQKICEGLGIAVVYTPCFPQVPVYGATRWLTGSPLIQLTDRNNTNDQFWFTFYHESAHVLLHGKKDLFIEQENKQVSTNEKEDQANQFASRLLLPESALQELPDGFNEQDVVQLAGRHKVHPGILVGRLQFLKWVDHKFGNDLKKKIRLDYPDLQ